MTKWYHIYQHLKYSYDKEEMIAEIQELVRAIFLDELGNEKWSYTN